MTYANVTVHDQRDTQDTVKDGVGRTTGNKCSGSYRKERGSEEPLECPMVRSLAPVRRRESRRIVHSPFVDRCTIP